MECDKGLYLYSNTLKNKSITIGKLQVTDVAGTGEFLFGKRIILPQLLQWFIDNGGAKKFSHIVIKSGDFSGRSRSYVSSDGSWHLTHQYYGGGSTIPDMIQAMRILHDRPDSIPLIVYAPAKVIDNLVKGDILQDEQIERLVLLNLNKHVKVRTHERIAEEEWCKDKVPTGKLCCGNVNKDFKIQKTQRVNDPDGGWAMEKYNEVLANVEKMVNVGMADSDDESDPEWLPEVESVSKKIRDGETCMNCLKRNITKFIADGNSNNFRTAADWFKITGLCGFATYASWHKRLMGELVKEEFIERRDDNKLRVVV